MSYSIIFQIRQSTIVEFLRSLLPHWLVNCFWHLPKAFLACFRYGFPGKKLKVIGVTGTDGKTTTSTLIYHILNKAHKKVALISTVSAKIGKKEIDTGFHVTTPDPFPLQKLLKEILDKGFEYVVLEATSQGLVQNRLWGIDFLAGVVTNITSDHLLYHKAWENYAAAKAKLFKNTKFSILNIEDKSYKFLKNKTSGRVISYGLKNGDFNLLNFKFTTKLPGDFNKLNCLAAAAATSNLAIDKRIILKGLDTFSGVAGRMEVFQEKPFKVIVDFAHTPYALKEVLKTIRAQASSNGRIISVFGCAAFRDNGRRKMGKVSAKFSDITIITAEDPRTEGVEKISEEIAFWARKGGAKEVFLKRVRPLSGTDPYPKKKTFIKIPDREKAIEFALEIAKKDDIVGIFGKGHERSMCFGVTETPWSDQEIVKEILKNKGGI